MTTFEKVVLVMSIVAICCQAGGDTWDAFKGEKLTALNAILATTMFAVMAFMYSLILGMVVVWPIMLSATMEAQGKLR